MNKELFKKARKEKTSVQCVFCGQPCTCEDEFIETRRGRKNHYIGFHAECYQRNFNKTAEEYAAIASVTEADFNKVETVKGNTMSEKKIEAPKNIDRERLITTVYNTAVNIVAGMVDTRVEKRSIQERDRQLKWKLEKVGRLTVDKGSVYDVWTLDDEFLCCIEHRWSKRKVHLGYPEITPHLHREDMRKPVEVKTVEDATVETVETVTVETVKELFKDNDSVNVNQKHEGCCIWVTGKINDDEKEKIKGIGFKYGTSRSYGKGWWYK